MVNSLEFTKQFFVLLLQQLNARATDELQSMAFEQMIDILNAPTDNEDGKISLTFR